MIKESTVGLILFILFIVIFSYEYLKSSASVTAEIKKIEIAKKGPENPYIIDTLRNENTK